MTFLAPLQKKRKYQHGYLNEASWQAECVFDNKNSLEIVPYSNKENYYLKLYLILKKVPYPGTERALMNLYYQKCIQPGNTGSWSTHSDIFKRKRRIYTIKWCWSRKFRWHILCYKTSPVEKKNDRLPLAYDPLSHV